MVTLGIRLLAAMTLVSAIVLGGAVGPVAAQADCDTACLDPGGDGPAVSPGGDLGFVTPVVELFLKAKKAFNDDFQTFLKAKKAF